MSAFATAPGLFKTPTNKTTPKKTNSLEKKIKFTKKHRKIV